MKRSKQSLSHYKLLTGSMGALIPISWYEVLPGDTVQHATSCLLRFGPLNAAIMHPTVARIHKWFVPFRIIWQDWQDFITGGADGAQYPTVPYHSNAASYFSSSLADYLGIPVTTLSMNINMLPFRAYNAIYNEWYRDSDLQSKRGLSLASGNDTTTDVSLAQCCWEKDYFTTARPWTQKGPAVTLPLGDRAPVKGIGQEGTGSFPDSLTVHETGGAAVSYANASGANATTPNRIMIKGTGASGAPDIYADLQNATAASINTLRHALALQRYEEARARYGSRYTEYLRYLGVRSSDARLQRPEYLGGSKSTIQFSEVLQTSQTSAGGDTDGRGPGYLFGHGISAMRTNRFRKFFEEHGIVMTLLSVRPKTVYTQSLNRFWGKTSKEDFWQKELETIGQQGVYKWEVDAQHAPNATDTFGFQDRYDEYRHIESTVAGNFRPGATAEVWHLGRDFGSMPAINADFVSCNPTDRIFQDTSQQLFVMANHNIQARRLVSSKGNSLTF